MNLLCIFVSFFDWSKWAGLGAGEREWGVEESYSGARNRSRCAQSLILLSSRVSLLLRSSTAGYAPPVRASFRRGVGLSLADRARTQALNLSVKPSGWVPQSSAAASALQLPPRLGSGSVFTIGRCETQGGRSSAGRLGGLRKRRPARRPSTLEVKHACRSLLWGAVPERAAAATPCQRLPLTGASPVLTWPAAL